MSKLIVSDFSVMYANKDYVSDVNFTLNQGEICALLGPNGSGKTTLLKGICSLLKSRDECSVDGKSLRMMNDKERAFFLSYIPQRSSIELAIEVLDVVLMGLYNVLPLFSSPSEEHVRDAKTALESVGLIHKAHANFQTLSEGEKQLVILSRALLQSTPFMLFDEPDSALDFSNKHRVMAIMRSVVSTDKAALICLHDANMALMYCTRALFINGGRIIHDIDLRSAAKADIELALTSIYGKVDVISHNGRYVVT